MKNSLRTTEMTAAKNVGGSTSERWTPIRREALSFVLKIKWGQRKASALGHQLDGQDMPPDLQLIVDRWLQDIRPSPEEKARLDAHLEAITSLHRPQTIRRRKELEQIRIDRYIEKRRLTLNQTTLGSPEHTAKRQRASFLLKIRWHLKQAEALGHHFDEEIPGYLQPIADRWKTGNTPTPEEMVLLQTYLEKIASLHNEHTSALKKERRQARSARYAAKKRNKEKSN